MWWRGKDGGLDRTEPAAEPGQAVDGGTADPSPPLSVDPRDTTDPADSEVDAQTLLGAAPGEPPVSDRRGVDRPAPPILSLITRLHALEDAYREQAGPAYIGPAEPERTEVAADARNDNKRLWIMPPPADPSRQTTETPSETPADRPIETPAEKI